jgi:hypothetical protein
MNTAVDRRWSRFWRRTRIAISAVSMLACVAFLGLWLRSYAWRDTAWVYALSNSLRFGISSGSGQLSIFLIAPHVKTAEQGSGFVSIRNTNSPTPERAKNDPYEGWPHIVPHYGVTVIALPFWFNFLISAAIGFLSWKGWRFSLRAVLIALTVAALAFSLDAAMRS